MRPTSARQVLVKLNKVEEKTDGGLFVPTAAKEKPKEGVVVAAGPGVVHPSTGKLLPNSVSVGDTVRACHGGSGPTVAVARWAAAMPRRSFSRAGGLAAQPARLSPGRAGRHDARR